MKLTDLTALLAVLSVVANLSFSPAYLQAAEKAKETPVTVRLDFIVEEIMRRGLSPGRKASMQSGD